MELDRELYPDFSTGGPVPEVIDPDEIYAFKLQLDDAMSQTQSNRWWLFYDDNEVCAEDWRSLNLAEKAKTEQVFLVIKYPEVKEPLDLTHTIGNEARHVFYSEHGSSSTGSLRSRAEPQDNTQEMREDPMIVDPQARTLLYGCARQSRGLLQEFSNEYGPSATELAVPSSLYNAFLTITCFMTSSIGHGRESDSAGRDLLRKFQRQLKQGREVMMRSIDPDPVSVKEAILPAGILASVLEWLLEFAPVDVSYMDMMYELERRAHRRAENEKDEELLWLLMQDIAKISGMTRDQEDLLLRLHNCLSTPATKTDKEAPFSDGKQSAMIFHLIKTASFKLGDFRMLAEKRGYIENMHNRNYLAKKDDREAASLTFAIVSVIFLPLTTVASILGMNTREVRDMQYTQWVFWATGIPLAILTGMFCLWCTSRLNKFKQWFRSHLLPRSKSGNRKLARPERETDPKIIGTDNGPDSNGEQICTVRRRWKRLKNREDQANNQV
ncbi:hypothetical protein IWZ00DRAFT_543150 [Phyllosticta capitalensis]